MVSSPEKAAAARSGVNMRSYDSGTTFCGSRCAAAPMPSTKLNTVTAKKRFIGVPFELVIRFCFTVRYLRKLRSDCSTHRPPLSVRIPYGIMDGGMAYKDSRQADELWQRFATCWGLDALPTIVVYFACACGALVRKSRGGPRP